MLFCSIVAHSGAHTAGEEIVCLESINNNYYNLIISKHSGSHQLVRKLLVCKYSNLLINILSNMLLMRNYNSGTHARGKVVVQKNK